MKILILPNKNGICPEVMRSVELLRKGVKVTDAQRRMIAWIPVSNVEHGEIVRDILTRVIQEGYRAVQPDWSFLNESAVAAN